MSKKLEIIGKKAMFTMSLKGGDLPSNYEVEINVTMDFTGATETQMIKCCASGQSARVALQGQLRKKTISDLDKLGREGMNVSFTDVIDGDVVSPVDRLLALTKEQFIEIISRDMGLDPEECEAIYDRKHGIKNEQ